MRRGARKAYVVTDATFALPSGRKGQRRTLLFSPPVYDAQYWARWSQPAGLLRIGALLQDRGYSVTLLDCMETDARGNVPKTKYVSDGGTQPQVVQRGNISRTIYHFGKRWDEVERQLRELDAPPHQVWISSIMTYWWESTRDAVRRIRGIFPKAEMIVGGIYPTLAPEHAREHLGPAGANVIFSGELSQASERWTALDLYRPPFHRTAPTYAILTTSRGCPWDCAYCAARTLNNGSPKMRARTAEDVLDEIEHKMKAYNIRRFGFYEDNALALRGHLQRVLELIVNRGHKLDLYAPEGFETRLLTEDLLRLMKTAGFEKVHLPFEALKWETNLEWNRRHASTASFDQALAAAIRAGFKPRTQEINAFVLFGLPDEKLEDIMDSVLYVHHQVGSIIPMLFTPVPGTQIYREHEQYLHQEMGWNLQHLNGKFLPFLEYNQRRYPTLRASDYLELEALMSILNDGKFLSRAVDLCDETSAASRAFRAAMDEAASIASLPRTVHAVSASPSKASSSQTATVSVNGQVVPTAAAATAVG